MRQQEEGAQDEYHPRDKVRGRIGERRRHAEADDGADERDEVQGGFLVGHHVGLEQAADGTGVPVHVALGGVGRLVVSARVGL